MSDLFLSTLSSRPLLLWLGGSLLVYVVAANLLWWIRSTALARSLYGRGLFQAGRFLYYVAIPYLALGGWRPTVPGWPQRGLLALEDMGLVGLSLQWPITRWLEAAGTGLGFGFLALLLLGLAWANAAQVSREEHPAGAISARRMLGFASHPWWAMLVGGLYLEVHWAFYRGGLAVALDQVVSLTTAVFAGLALVGLEWILNPFWRAGWRTASRGGEVWLNAGLVLTSALLFLLTRNFWICLVIHWLLALPFRLLARPRQTEAASASSEPRLGEKNAA